MSDAQVVRGDFYVTDGTVRAMVRAGSALYIGGDFTRVGPATGAGVPIDTVTGIALSGFPKIVGTVLAAAPDGAGGWYVGGDFGRVGDAPRSHLAHILSDNTVAPWNPDADGSVSSINVGGSTIYVAGAFTNIGGQPRQHLAAVDAATGLVTGWDPNPDGSVSALATDGSTVFVSGLFANIGGQPRHNLAALDAATGLATAWDANPDAAVGALALSGTTLYAGGEFTSIGGQPRNYLAALNTTTGLAIAWNPGLNGPVYSLAANGANVYANGDFTNCVGPYCFYGFGAFDATTALPLAWHTVAGPGALAADESTLYAAGGAVDAVTQEHRGRLSALDATTGDLKAWDPYPNGPVDCLAVSGTSLFAGGSFTSVGGQARGGLAAIDVGTGAVTDWAPDVRAGAGWTRRIHALATDGSRLYAGGMFTLSIPVPGDTNATRHNLAAFDLATGEPNSWNPNSDPSGWYDLFRQRIATLAIRGATVYVGGRFTHLAGQTRNYIVALDGVTGEATPWNPSANDSISTIVVDGNTVYVAGTFDRVGGVTRYGLAALDAAKQDSTDGIVTAWDPNPWPPSSPDPWGDWPGAPLRGFGPIRAVAVGSGSVYLCGAFGALGGHPSEQGQLRNSLGAVDAVTGLPTAWDPWPLGSVWPPPGFISLDVSALAVTGPTVYVGGLFQTGNPPHANLIALDATTGLSTAWNPDPVGGVDAVLVEGMTVYAGGSFGSVGGLPQSGVAAMGDLTTPTQLSLVDAVAEPGRVRLTWFSGEAGDIAATVYRRTLTNDWTAVAAIVGNGSGRLSYEDIHVEAATRYGYRLGLSRLGVESFYGEAWVDVPGALAFALAGPCPNPAHGDLRVAFSLPDASPARLELLDVAGRRIDSREVGTLGAGEHVARLVSNRGLSPGIYLVRLTRGGRSLTSRALVLD